MMYSDFLEANDFRVAGVADGADAVRWTKRLRPALVVLDIQMPGRDGVSALRRIRQDKDVGHTPVLVLSAYDNREEEARDAGATAFCVKPCTPDALLAQIRKLLSKSASQR